MNTYFALFIIATVASLTITPLIRRLCDRFKLLDVPADGRRLHKRAIPVLGGVAIYLSCVIALSTLPFVDNILTQSLRLYKTEIFVAFIPATLVLLLGIYDDVRGANATVKFVTLGLIASLFFAMGGRIEGLTLPFFGSVQLPIWLAYAITVLWLVGIANAFNLIDGLDGLASGAALFSSLVILVVSFVQAQPLMIVFSLVLCGALAGFLRYNFNPASIFLGDSGALFVGFSLAALSVLVAQKATTAVAVSIPILAFALPVVDTGVTMARRLISGRPIFQGDKEHIHHMLLARGWSQRRVALILYVVSASFGLVAILFTSTGSRLIGFGLFVLAVVMAIAMGRLRYHEVEELKAGVKRTVGNRRARVANNIRVRRAGVAMSQASNLDQLFEALKELLEFEEFSYAKAQFGQPNQAELNARAFSSTEHQKAKQRVEFTNGQILWSWKRNGVNEKSIVGSSDYWCFRLPLSTASGDWGWINLYRPLDGKPLLIDMNYMAGLLRTELSAATERIIQSFDTPSAAKKMHLTVSAGKVAG